MTEDTMADPVDDPDAAAPDPPKSDPVAETAETDPSAETQSGEPA